uniref:Secreted peptide n=1 Tax=Pristhesancus plagipennis TaxID=1955184 RepID=A0A2K8JLZ0_PRIPG|nr:secreted peptide [Pristhesancus plagipennis]
MISVLVMLICITLSVLCIVCCFWSPCPLYSMCRINYTYGDVVAYSKEEESALSLPPDESFLSNTYSPVPIKVIQVSEHS